MGFHQNIIFMIEIIGTAAFAASGAMTAIRKELDLFGIIMLGTITAVGGGIIRDIVIGRIPPNTFLHPVYITVAMITAIFLFLLFYFKPELDGSKHIKISEKVLNILDAVGLGAFTVIGIDAGIEAGYEKYYFLLIFLGVTTGIGGGILRDIMAGEIPYVLKKQIYACASIAGAGLYTLLLQFSQSDYTMLISAGAIIFIRMLASRFDWNLPVVKKTNTTAQNEDSSAETDEKNSF